jgi:hypothetical protein
VAGTAGSGGGAWGRGGSTSIFAGQLRQLPLPLPLPLQARRESLPWLQELVLPLLDGPPQPLTGRLAAGRMPRYTLLPL